MRKGPCFTYFQLVKWKCKACPGGPFFWPVCSLEKKVYMNNLSTYYCHGASQCSNRLRPQVAPSLHTMMHAMMQLCLKLPSLVEYFFQDCFLFYFFKLDTECYDAHAQSRDGSGFLVGQIKLA